MGRYNIYEAYDVNGNLICVCRDLLVAINAKSGESATKYIVNVDEFTSGIVYEGWSI